MSTPFSISVYKQYFNFASSHFLIFKDGTREPLHGHNYRVEFRGNALELESDMVFDFLDIKPIVREVCDSLDHKLLLPGENPQINIIQEDRTLRLECPDGDIFQFPTSDVLILPIENTSAERIAIYICHEVKKIVKERFEFEFESLQIEVEETPGQSAIYSYQKRIH
ncbi:MAG: 6-carboxytetrahydropterin synthase [Halobacteriovoraceae bacterium]|nr:6-carboxytetrahydropterin synthase [Halobacteriovoraceae bacterium]